MRLAIVSPNQFKYSETFIHSHFRELAGEKILLHGDYLPNAYSHSLEGEAFEFPIGILGRKSLEGRIARFLKKQRINLILAEYGQTGVEMMPIARKLGIPLVVHFHGFDAYRGDAMASYGKRYAEMFRTASAVIGVSRHMIQRLSDLGAPKEKLHYIPYGVDPEKFSVTDPSKSSPHFIAVGRLVEKKAPLKLLEAFWLAWQESPGIRLTIAGDGPLRTEVESFIKTRKMNEVVTLVGKVSHDEVSRLMQTSRAFVQHSVTTEDGDSEGTPLSVLEAGSTGLPVIATKHAGISDVIENEHNGFIVDEGEVELMAKCIVRLANDVGLAKRLGENAQKVVESRFTMNRYIGELDQLIQSFRN